MTGEMTRRIIVYLIMIIVSINGCKITRVSEKSGDLIGIRNVDELRRKLAEDKTDYENIWIKRYNCEIRDNFKRQTFYGDIKIVNGEKIMITVKSGIGIESGRMMINRDSVIFVDRVHKEIVMGNYEQWENYFELIKEYKTAENLLTGDKELVYNVLENHKGRGTEIYKRGKDKLVIDDSNSRNDHKGKILLEIDGYKIVEYFVRNRNNDEIKINYIKWKEIKGLEIPDKLDIKIRVNNDERRAILTYERVVVNEKMKTVFRIPQGYKVITL